jgi:hypothetical protein
MKRKEKAAKVMTPTSSQLDWQWLRTSNPRARAFLFLRQTETASTTGGCCRAFQLQVMAGLASYWG